MTYTYQSPFPEFPPRTVDTLNDALNMLSLIYDATGQVGTIEGVPVRTDRNGSVVVDTRQQNTVTP